MKKWEDSLNKSTLDCCNNKNSCWCMNNQGLFIPNRQLSAIIAGLLFVLFCTFITGYFLGKKYTVEILSQKIQNDFNEDKITTSAFLSNPVCSSTLEEVQTPNAQTIIIPVVEENIIPLPVTTINQEIVDMPESHQQYYAQLIGFGTEKSAEQFVKKLAAKGITTRIKKRTSKTVKGHVSYWYQVVTTAYVNKNDLLAVVDKLVKEERLKDVCIQVC